MEKPKSVQKFLNACHLGKMSKGGTKFDVIIQNFSYFELKEIKEWIENEQNKVSTEIILRKIKEAYDKGINDARSMNYVNAQEGVERRFSEKFMENILIAAVNEVREQLNLNVKLVRGTDDYFTRKLMSDSGKVLTDDKIQVDFNLYHNNKLVAVIEVKSNLDKCYLKRTVSDFEDIASSIKENGGDPSNIKYIIFVGQSAINDETLEFFKTRFSDYGKKYSLGNINFNTFFIINNKRNRYRKEINTIYRKNPGINEDAVRKFVPYLLNTLKGEA